MASLRRCSSDAVGARDDATPLHASRTARRKSLGSEASSRREVEASDHAAPLGEEGQQLLGRYHTRKFLEVSLICGVEQKTSSCEETQETALALTTAQLLQTRAKSLTDKRLFGFFISSMIVLNALHLGLETEFGKDDPGGFWRRIEVAFTVVFIMELVLRIAAAPNLLLFVREGWNLFDVGLVLMSILDICLTSLVRSRGRSPLLAAAQTLRLARIVRVIRLFRFFHELWVLVAGIVDAMWTLVWTWVLMALLVYTFGIFTTRTIGQPNSDHEDIQVYFGTLPRSMFTLFQITTTEAWADVARTCMRREGWSWAFFVFYIYTTTFAVMNVVVAVIVENTLDQASSQRERFLEKQKVQQKEACAKIYTFFCDADADGDGILTRQEFEASLKEGEMRKYLHQLGIDMRQAENLFCVLDYDESGSLDAQEFVGGVMKASGLARAKDILAMQCDLWRSQDKTNQKIGHIVNEAETQLTAIERGVADLRQDFRLLLTTLSGRRASCAK